MKYSHFKNVFSVFRNVLKKKKKSEIQQTKLFQKREKKYCIKQANKTNKRKIQTEN